MSETKPQHVALAASHRGRWSGENRLWLAHPSEPARSAGSIDAEASVVRYGWSHEGRAHEGTLHLKGQPAACSAVWNDTFHATDSFTLHGFLDEGVLRLFTTYDAGDQSWGWRIELDVRDPDAFVLRMFNVPPATDPEPAVILIGRR